MHLQKSYIPSIINHYVHQSELSPSNAHILRLRTTLLHTVIIKSASRKLGTYPLPLQNSLDLYKPPSFLLRYDPALLQEVKLLVDFSQHNAIPHTLPNRTVQQQGNSTPPDLWVPALERCQVQQKEHSGIEFEGSRNGLLYLDASVVKYDRLDRVYYLEERRREVVELELTWLTTRA